MMIAMAGDIPLDPLIGRTDTNYGCDDFLVIC